MGLSCKSLYYFPFTYGRIFITHLTRLLFMFGLIKGGMKPELISSVVGPVSSTTNNILNGLKSLFLGAEASTKVTEGEGAELAKAMEQITTKINDSSSCLTELEVCKF